MGWEEDTTYDATWVFIQEERPETYTMTMAVSPNYWAMSGIVNQAFDNLLTQLEEIQVFFGGNIDGE
ncbi:MAG: hypothetical protein MRZ79_00550 [Bacteroidia bacterium]|nr:hypothetical protein [Bacteroidia bacterium]